MALSRNTRSGSDTSETDLSSLHIQQKSKPKDNLVVSYNGGGQWIMMDHTMRIRDSFTTAADVSIEMLNKYKSLIIQEDKTIMIKLSLSIWR